MRVLTVLQVSDTFQNPIWSQLTGKEGKPCIAIGNFPRSPPNIACRFPRLKDGMPSMLVVFPGPPDIIAIDVTRPDPPTPGLML